MTRAGQMLAVLCVVAFVGMLCGCGGSGGPSGPADSVAKKPVKPPPDDPPAPADWAVTFIVTDKAGRERVWVATADGETCQQVTARGDLEVAELMPTWTPDGSRIVFFHQPDAWHAPDAIYSVQPDGEGLSLIATCPPLPYPIRTILDVFPDDPDGRRVLTATDGYNAVYLSDWTGGEPVIQNLEARVSEGGLNLLRWTDDGTLAWWPVAYYGDGKATVGPDLGGGSYGFHGLIAYDAFQAGGSSHAEGRDICLIEVDTTVDGTLERADGKAGGPTCWLDLDGDQRAPAVSPDGHWIAYIQNESLTSQTLWVAEVIYDVDSHLVEIGDPDQLVTPSGSLRRPSWLPNSQWVAFNGGGLKYTPRQPGPWVDVTLEKLTSVNWPDWHPMVMP